MSNQVGSAQCKPEITQEMVDVYAQINAQYAALGKDRDALRKQIVEAFEAGAHCPDEGPYILNLTYQERAASSWKDICYAVLDLMGERLKDKAIRLIEQMLDAKVRVGQVTVAANPVWEGHK